MHRMYLIILAAAVIACAGVGLAQRDSPRRSDALAGTKWEYGVYRVGAGQHKYEWQDADRRVYADAKNAFLEKMGLFSIITRQATYTDAPNWALAYTLDAEFLNHLGAQGWELESFIDRGSGAIDNRTFWFKRPE